MFYQNRPFNPPYNNQPSFFHSSTGLYRPIMDSSTTSQSNQLYSSLNRVELDMNFEQLIYSQDYYVGQGSGHDNQDNYPSQDYSMGHCSAHSSAHGSAPVDDDSSVEKMSPVKSKKPLKRTSKAKKNDNNEPAKDWTTAKEITLCKACCDVSENRTHPKYMASERIPVDVRACLYVGAMLERFEGSCCLDRYWDTFSLQEQKGSKKSKVSETTSGPAQGGFNLNDEADESEKRLKKSDRDQLEKMKEQQDSYIQLKNQELDIHEAGRQEAADFKREKLKMQRRALELAEKEKKKQKHLIL
nr:hypothetical protein [Tanacetum cinerariifolium]